MQLVVLGLNHKTAPVDVRETFSLSEERIRASLTHLDDYSEIAECVILSTCNRTEVYAVMDEDETVEAKEELKAFLLDMAKSSDVADEYFYAYYGADCIRHLFRVASSLDSLVIGEGQILNQVKKAYSVAKAEKATRTVLNMLFHRAIKTGKKVRTETRIAYSAVSVSYAAVELAKKTIGDLSHSNVLLLGAGQMGELTARHLVANGVKTVFVSNRKYLRAAELAETFGGIAVPFEEFMQSAESADVIITSTGAPHYLVERWDVERLMAKRAHRPLIFIDIAVPRDVEPEVGEVPNVNLYNIDDLEAVVESNLQIRQQEAEEAESIIEEAMDEMIERFRYLEYRPVMALLSDKAERIRRREVKRAMAKLGGLSIDERRAVKHLSKMIVRKLLRDPMICLNEAALEGREDTLIDAISELFKLDTTGEGESREENSGDRYARQ
ncbi:MAG: glutamyl-tRNA reductase [Selenomonadales bacterium]|nr:glutamyl-tRNA reductase [Selenomonadales bacterium]MBQ5746131.1 glutamyl-tRNA reductase [Selenomonadales bacterium]